MVLATAAAETHFLEPSRCEAVSHLHRQGLESRVSRWCQTAGFQAYVIKHDTEVSGLLLIPQYSITKLLQTYVHCPFIQQSFQFWWKMWKDVGEGGLDG